MNPATNEARRAAMRLLRAGLARPHELAQLAGVSRRVVAHWIRIDRVEHWRAARINWLTGKWRKELKRGTELVKR
jgi:hypothetical protein